jgi:hypothetical protein
MDNANIFYCHFGYISRPFRKFCGHSVYFMVIWYTFPCFGMLYQGKSGNPGRDVLSVRKNEEFREEKKLLRNR